MAEAESSKAAGQSLPAEESSLEESSAASSSASSSEESSASSGHSSSSEESSDSSSSASSSEESSSSSEAAPPVQTPPEQKEPPKLPPDLSIDTTLGEEGSDQIKYGVEISWDSLEFSYAPRWNPDTYSYDTWESSPTTITVRNTSENGAPLRVALTFVPNGDWGITAVFSPCDGDETPEDFEIIEDQIIFLLPRSKGGAKEATISLSLFGEPAGWEDQQYVQIGSIKADITSIQDMPGEAGGVKKPSDAEPPKEAIPSQPDYSTDGAGAQSKPESSSSEADSNTEVTAPDEQPKPEESSSSSAEESKPDGKFTNTPQEDTT